MQFNTSVKMIAGAVALVMASHAFAQNVAGSGDIYLAIDDTQTGATSSTTTELLYDTGISASSFTGTSSLAPINVPGAAALLGTATPAGDTSTFTFSVYAGTNTGSASTNYDDLFASSTAVSPAASGSKVKTVFNDLNTQLINAGVSGAGTEATTTSNASEYNGIASAVSSNLGLHTLGAIGSALDFYSASTTTGSNFAKSTFAGTWTLTSGGQLDYVVAPVPLPAPLLLLVSGLGLMGVFGRRRGDAV